MSQSVKKFSGIIPPYKFEVWSQIYATQGSVADMCAGNVLNLREIYKISQDRYILAQFLEWLWRTVCYCDATIYHMDPLISTSLDRILAYDESDDTNGLYESGPLAPVHSAMHEWIKISDDNLVICI